MKKSNLLKSLPLFLALAACQTFNKSQQPADDVISTYKGGNVTIKDVTYELDKLTARNDKIKGISFDKLNTDQKEALVKEVVLKKIAYAEAKKRGLNRDKDYQEALELFESDLLKQKLLVTLVKDAQDEKNVKKNYDELAEKLKGKKDFKISYIAVKTEKEANEIYAILLRSPSSFAAQAKRKSVDKETAKKGGDLGFVVEDSMPADLIKEVKSLEKNQISKPIFTSGKWVLLKVEDERPAELLPYDEVKTALAQNLAKKAVDDFVSQSIKNAEISMVVK